MTTRASQVTTELQAFGLIVTAEPYFAVTQPSDVVVMENVVRDDTKGKVETVQAKYELLKRGSYLMNQSANFKAQTARAGRAARSGGGAQCRGARSARRSRSIRGRHLRQGGPLLSDAEVAREKRKRGNDVMMPARQAAQTAEDARLIALQRQEQEFVAQEREVAAQRERAALDRADAERERARVERDRAQAEEARRRQAELDAQAAAAAKAAAERERLDIERSRLRRR